MWLSSQSPISRQPSSLTKQVRDTTFKLSDQAWRFLNCPPKPAKEWPTTWIFSSVGAHLLKLLPQFQSNDRVSTPTETSCATCGGHATRDEQYQKIFGGR